MALNKFIGAKYRLFVMNVGVTALGFQHDIDVIKIIFSVMSLYVVISTMLQIRSFTFRTSFIQNFNRLVYCRCYIIMASLCWQSRKTNNKINKRTLARLGSKSSTIVLTDQWSLQRHTVSLRTQEHSYIEQRSLPTELGALIIGALSSMR